MATYLTFDAVLQALGFTREELNDTPHDCCGHDCCDMCGDDRSDTCAAHKTTDD